MSTITKVTGFKWQKDGSATVWARVTARDATGQATPFLGEGNYIKQADLSAITAKVFDRSDPLTPDTPTSTPTVTISTSILDTPDTTGLIAVDDAGNAVPYNFRFDMPATSFPTGSHKYLVEFYFVTTGGTKWAIQYEDVAAPLVGG